MLNNLKIKKLVKKGYTLYDSIYIKFFKMPTNLQWQKRSWWFSGGSARSNYKERENLLG